MFRNLNRLVGFSRSGLSLKKSESIIIKYNQICFKSDYQSFNNVRNTSELKNYRKNLEAIILLKPEYRNISNNILRTATKQATLDSNNERDLEKKLNFKLGLIVVCFKRLTEACEKNYLDNQAKLGLIKEILTNELSNKNIEEVENEFDFLELLGFDVNENDEIDDILSELYPTDQEIAREKLDYFLHENGTKIDVNNLNRFGEKFVEYTEDIVKSVEKEIEEKASDLRKDFPNIDKHLKDLKCIITKEWLDDYKDRYLDAQFNQFDFGWENEDGDPEFICP